MTDESAALKPGSTLRFRVEDPERGVESATWSIVSSKNTGDLYFAAREIMGSVKLSLHKSGITRMAWTSEAAEGRFDPGVDRMLSRWTAAAEVGSGWSLVLRLSIPDLALSPILPPLPGKPRKATVSIPAAGPGRSIEVRVLLAAPDSGVLRLVGQVLEVGRMLLGNGGKVVVTAWDHEMTAEAEAQLMEVRTRAVSHGAANRPSPRAWACGSENETAIPLVLDAGDPRQLDAIPEESPRYDGPPNVVIGELPPDRPSSTDRC